MKLSILVFSSLVTFLSVFAHAESKDNPLSLEQLKSRLEVRGEIFYFDSEGKRLLEKSSQWRLWRLRMTSGKAEIESRWSSGSVQGNEFAIHHVWTVQEDGSVKVLIEEYARVEEGKGSDGKSDVKFVDLIKKDERVLSDFSPISWVSVRPDHKRRVVIRFTPNLSDEPEPRRLVDLPISGSEIMITDNVGNLWTEHNTLSGKFVGFTTHKGSVFISYSPFKGASEIGFASGKRIELRLDGTKVATLTSQTDFVPVNVRALVYGIYRPSQRTTRLTSTHTRSSSEESKFLKSMNSAEVH